MIVRSLGEGQWRIDDAVRAELNSLDDEVEAAVRADDSERLGVALSRLHDRVRAIGAELPLDELADSDLILPETDASLAEVRALLSESGEGLIPD